jgi:hypothetical protein
MEKVCSTHGRDEKYILSENLKEREHMGDMGIYERIILKWIRFEWLRMGSNDELRSRPKEHLISIKDRRFFN